MRPLFKGDSQNNSRLVDYELFGPQSISLRLLCLYVPGKQRNHENNDLLIVFELTGMSRVSTS